MRWPDEIFEQKVNRDEMALDRARGGGAVATRNSREAAVGMWEEPVLCQSALLVSHCPKLDQLGSALIWVTGELQGKKICLWRLNYWQGTGIQCRSAVLVFSGAITEYLRLGR